MKSAIGYLLCSAIVLFSLSAESQKLSVTDQKVKTEEEKDIDSWTAHLDLDANSAEETFSDFIESTYKLKVNKRTKSVYSVDKARFSDISYLRMDVRAVFEQEPGGRSVSFTFSPGHDVHLGHDLYTAEFQLAEAFAKSYVRYHYTTWYNKQVADLNNKIRKKESDVKSEENKIEKLRKSISENDEKIQKSDPDMQKLKDRNTKSYKEIEERTNNISSLKKDIANIQNDVIKANDNLKNVAEFK